MTYLAELQETRAAVREHGGEFNSFSRVLTGVLVRWDGTRGVSVTDLRTNLRSPPFWQSRGRTLIAFVYEPAALRYSPERKNSFPSSFMVANSSGRAGISMAADTMVGPSLLCAPLGTDERHLVNFFRICERAGRGESRTEPESNRILASRDPICRRQEKNLSPIFTGSPIWRSARIPVRNTITVPSAHRKTPWRPPQQVSRRPRPNPRRSRRVRGPRRLGPRFPFFGPLVIFSSPKAEISVGADLHADQPTIRQSPHPRLAPRLGAGRITRREQSRRPGQLRLLPCRGPARRARQELGQPSAEPFLEGALRGPAFPGASRGHLGRLERQRPDPSHLPWR